VRELYSEDVFRTGDNGLHDYATSLGLGTEWDVTAPRSTWRLQYTPQYFAYRKFNELDHLDHVTLMSWKFQPGRRSTFGFNQGYSFSNRQATLVEFQGLPVEQANPVVPTTRRTVWDVSPFQIVDLSRRWNLATEEVYRSQSFSRADLIDSTQAGLQTTLTARVGDDYHLGGRVRADRFDFSAGTATASTAQLDRFLIGELVWSRDSKKVFNWSLAAGLFRATGGDANPVEKPTARVEGTWAYRASHLLMGYELGYASSGGFGGATRSHTGQLTYLRHWGTAFDTTLQGSYIRREPLDSTTIPGSAVEGGSLEAQGVYRWRTGLGLEVQIDAVRQNRSGASPLDYREASVGLVFGPPPRPKPPAAPPPPGTPEEPAPEPPGR